MKQIACLMLVGLLPFAGRGAEEPTPIPNPLIDYPGFQKIVNDAALEREPRRLTEEAFLKMMAQPGVVLLDARSAINYQRRHIKGAVNLPFTEFTAESLARVIPRADTPVLIYCNNNFLGSPVVFASKSARASLNVSTYASLRAYEYSNIYELGPLLDVRATRIPFAGTEVEEGEGAPGPAPAQGH